jgi:hypothetical protein
MASLFLLCALLGTVLLVLQLVGAGLGDADAHTGVGELHAVDAIEQASHGLHLFSVRALTAALAFFGVAGWFALRGGWPMPLAFIAALATGGAAMIGVATVLRSMRRLESDGTLQVRNAIGLDGVVHLQIPSAGAGAGKVLMTVQGRLVELPAVTGGAAIPTGAAVTVVDVRDDDVLDVRPAQDDPLLSEA